VEAYRQVASCMANNIIHRLAARAEEWTDDDRDEPRIACCDAAGQQARSNMAERCRELEEEIRRKKEEVAQRQETLLAECRAEFGAALDAREQELVQVQRCVASDSVVVSSADEDVSSPAAGAPHLEIASQVSRIRAQLAAARRAADELESKKGSLQRVEAFQQKGPSAMEELLTSLAGLQPSSLEEEEEEESTSEEALLGAVARDEQICRRLQARMAGGA